MPTLVSPVGGKVLENHGDTRQSRVKVPRKLSRSFCVVNPCWSLILGLFLGLGCVAEEDPEVLTLSGSEPFNGGTHPVDAPIRLRFEQYLFDSPSQGLGIELVSGDRNAAVSVAYDPVDRALVLQPDRELRVGLGYVLRVPADSVFGFGGERLAEDLEIDFRAGPRVDYTPRPPVDFELHLLPKLEASCYCHGEDAWPPLDPATWVGQAARRQPERSLVVPGEALQSYLIQRVLADYPGVRGAPMPTEAPLDAETLKALVSWVEAGAPSTSF